MIGLSKVPSTLPKPEDIKFNIFKPSTTFPITVYCPFNDGISSNVIKNEDQLVSFPLLHNTTTPGTSKDDLESISFSIYSFEYIE